MEPFLVKNTLVFVYHLLRLSSGNVLTYKECCDDDRIKHFFIGERQVNRKVAVKLAGGVASLNHLIDMARANEKQL